MTDTALHNELGNYHWPKFEQVPISKKAKRRQSAAVHSLSKSLNLKSLSLQSPYSLHKTR